MNVPFNFLLEVQLKVSLLILIGFVVLGLLRVFTRNRVSVIDQNFILKLTVVATLLLPFVLLILKQGNIALPFSEITVYSPLQAELIFVIPNNSASSSIWNVLTFAYTAVTSILLLFFIVRFVVISNKARKADDLRNSDDLDLLNRIKGQIGLTCAIELKIIDQPVSPYIWGIKRKYLVLPPQFSNWDAETKRVVFFHELLHLKHSDQITLIAAHLCCFLYWCNPLVWLLSVLVLNSTEKSCDARVVNAGIDNREYVSQLVSVIKSLHRAKPTSNYVCSMAKSADLTHRIKSVLNNSQRRSEMTIKKFITAISGSTFLFLIIATGQITTAQVVKDHPLLPAKRTPPVYPVDALSNKIEGWVILEFDISADGEVINPRVINSEPQELFEKSALESVSEWIYEPNSEMLPYKGMREKIIYLLAPEKQDASTGDSYQDILDRQVQLNDLRKQIIDAVRYPDSAMNRGIEGDVRVKFNLTSNSLVENFQIIQSSIPDVFDETIRTAGYQDEFNEAVKTAVYQGAKNFSIDNKNTVEMKDVEMPFAFKLNLEPKPTESL